MKGSAFEIPSLGECIIIYKALESLYIAIFYILYIYISYDHISTECITDIYYFLLFPGYYSLSVHIVTVHNGEVMSVMDKVPLKSIDVLQFLHILRYGKAACGGICLGNIP